MNGRWNGTAWVVFYDGLRELARMTADDATPDEIEETCELLAYDNGCEPDEIEFRLEVSPFADVFTVASGRS